MVSAKNYVLNMPVTRNCHFRTSTSANSVLSWYVIDTKRIQEKFGSGNVIVHFSFLLPPMQTNYLNLIPLPSVRLFIDFSLLICWCEPQWAERRPRRRGCGMIDQQRTGLLTVTLFRWGPILLLGVEIRANGKLEYLWFKFLDAADPCLGAQNSFSNREYHDGGCSAKDEGFFETEHLSSRT